MTRSLCCLPAIRDVVLPDVPVDPVGEVQEPVVHADDDVGDDPGHVGQDPPLHLRKGLKNAKRNPAPNFGPNLESGEHFVYLL